MRTRLFLTLFLAFTVQAIAGAEPAWPSFRGTLDGGGAGVTDAAPVPEAPGVLWFHNCEDNSQYISSPVVCGQTAYVGTARLLSAKLDGAIQCFNALDGKLRWERPTRHPVFGSPVVANGRLYCGEGLHEDEDSHLYCLDTASGDLVFTIATDGHVESAPTLAGNHLVFAAGNDGVYCVTANTGRLLWHSQCGHCDCSAAIVDGRVYLGTAYGANSAVCLDLESGQTKWKAPQDLPLWGHPAVAGEQVFFGLGNGTFSDSDPHPEGAIVSLDAQDGHRLWRAHVDDAVNTSLCLHNEEILFGSRDGYAYCVSQKTGALRWKSLCAKPVLASLVVQDKCVIVAAGDGSVYGLNRADGKQLWHIEVSSAAFESSPILAAGRLYVAVGTSFLCLGR